MSKILLNERGEFDYPTGIKSLRDFAVKKLSAFYSSDNDLKEEAFTVVMHIDHEGDKFFSDVRSVKTIETPKSVALIKPRIKIKPHIKYMKVNKRDRRS